MESTGQPLIFKKHRNVDHGLDTMAALAASGKFMISHLQPHEQLPHLVKPIDHYPQHGGGHELFGPYGDPSVDLARYGPNLLTRYGLGPTPVDHRHPYRPAPPLRLPIPIAAGHPVSKSTVVSSERLNNYNYRPSRPPGDELYRGFNAYQQPAAAAWRGRSLVGGILKNNIGGSGRRENHRTRTNHHHPLIYDPKQYECFSGADGPTTHEPNGVYRTGLPPPPSVKNTNSAERNYNVNYSLNFTKNQYNILISPPLHPDLRPRIAVPPYTDDDDRDDDDADSDVGRRFHRPTEEHRPPQGQEPGYAGARQRQEEPHANFSGPLYLSPQSRDGSTRQPLDLEPGLLLTEKQLLAQQEAYAVGKMQREEIIIEHSQLMGSGGGGADGSAGPGARIVHPAGPGPLPPFRGRRDGSKGALGAFGVLGQGHHFTQIIAALAVSLGPLAAGLGKGYSSPAIDNLQELQNVKRGNYTHFSVNDQQVSWIASLSLLGALFGGMFGGLAMQFGRKRVLTLMSLPFSISWILTMFAKSVETMFFTAFVGGFCCAIVSSVAQVYVSEIASPDIRGFLSAIQKIAGHFGMLISYLLGAYLDWRQLAMLIAMAPIMLFISVIYIPETPSFLVLRGCDEEAHRSLQWLRGPHKNVELELDTIRSNVRTTRMNLLNRMTPSSGATTAAAASSNGVPVGNGLPAAEAGTAQPSLPFAAQRRGLRQYLEMVSFEALVANVKSVLRNVRLVKPILITCGLMIFQRFTGASSFNFYAVTIFRKTFAGMNPHGAAIAVGFVQLLASMLSGLLIDTVGRIPLLIVSSIFMSLALAGFGSCVYYGETSKMLLAESGLTDVSVANGQNDWIPLLCVLVFTVAFALGISPISWLLVGELFPLEYRAIGSSIATSFSYFCAFLSVKTFVDFQSFLGLHGTFWMYACISCVGLFFVIMVVPETKGRDLEEMDPRYVRTLTINR
ncbi:uncharacterized protein LOC128270950 [Anopheles cruzii]|uniref:uncharacterized protein LOC128270950 n=1 Tax=Anopheles cruzii TaxID=68878 RepID=UPI0022EC77DB|nr:uncharacterized protein LOC128270950 [Anopheles cruzii]